MMWFGKFVRLLYIAYLYCEYDLRNFIFLFLGAFFGLFLLLFCSPAITISDNSPMYAIITPYFIFTSTYNMMALYNVGIVLTLLLQYSISVILCYSMFVVGYMYDNQKWGYVKLAKDFRSGLQDFIYRIGSAIARQINIDMVQSEINMKKHNVDTEELIKKLKDKFKILELKIPEASD